jgi:thiosulfate dehydrogenase [quinone] large subunit
LFFGYAAGGEFFALFGIEPSIITSIIGAIVLGAGAAAAAWYSVARYENVAPTPGEAPHTYVQVQDPPVQRFFFQDTRSAALWLPIRIFLGVSWLEGGWHKVTDPAWMDTGAAIRGYWERAVVIPESGRAPINYDWWRAFLQGLLDADAHVWFGKLIAVGELAVGLGLIFGALVGIAAFGGILMNVSFLLSGSTSTNPVLLLLGVLVVMGWKVAGWIGLDRYLLPLVGTPWQRGVALGGTAPPVTTPPRASVTR